MELKTRIFRMSTSRFVLEMVFRYAAWWLAGLSLLGVLGLVLGLTVDLAWLLGALFLICCIAPVILIFVYYFHAMRVECAVNTARHFIVVDDEGIQAIVSALKENDNEDNELNPESEDAAVHSFPFSSFSKFKIGSDSVILPLKSPRKGFLWIPADAFDKEGEMEMFLHELDSRIS